MLCIWCPHLNGSLIVAESIQSQMQMSSESLGRPLCTCTNVKTYVYTGFAIEWTIQLSGGINQAKQGFQGQRKEKGPRRYRFYTIFCIEVLFSMSVFCFMPSPSRVFFFLSFFVMKLSFSTRQTSNYQTVSNWTEMM